MKTKQVLADVLIAIPGSLLIIMGMLLFNTLLERVFHPGVYSLSVLLCVTSLITGLLARLLRPWHGLGTAIACGLFAGLILLCLRLGTPSSAAPNPVFGPVGLLITAVFCPLGALLLPKLKRRAR